MRHAWILVGAPLSVLLVTSSTGSCGSSPSAFGDGGSEASGGTTGGTTGTLHLDDGSGVGPASGGGTTTLPDGALVPVCNGPLCGVSAKDNCAGKGTPFTSITGVVYDPAGALPLYDIYVYIPSSTPDPIDPGNPACTPCEAPASGGPIIGTLTDEHGAFTLVQPDATSLGVPSGTSIPLVIQTGKWRKQITIQTVTACAATAIPDPATPAGKLRLPANSSEGDMPIIAFTSGCDPAECFLRHVGISDSEFVAPGAPLPVPWTAAAAKPAMPTPEGAGHVRFYTGRNEQTSGGNASMVSGGNTYANTYMWWTSSANLLENDIIFNACECSPYDRGAAAYPAMDAYLKGGGRLFTTHYYYNWFAPTTGTADLESVASWNPNKNTNSPTETEMDTIDQTFPKGIAFATWLQDNAITTTLGSITLGDTRDNMNNILPAGCQAAAAAGAGSCLSTQWIYNKAQAHPRYISFNTPVAAPVANQCGRAVFSDVHLSGTTSNATFPEECMDSNLDPTSDHVTNEKALEFLFFDLSSCVQNDYNPSMNMPPPSNPPPK